MLAIMDAQQLMIVARTKVPLSTCEFTVSIAFVSPHFRSLLLASKVGFETIFLCWIIFGKREISFSETHEIIEHLRVHQTKTWYCWYFCNSFRRSKFFCSVFFLLGQHFHIVACSKKARSLCGYTFTQFFYSIHLREKKKLLQTQPTIFNGRAMPVCVCMRL